MAAPELKEVLFEVKGLPGQTELRLLGSCKELGEWDVPRGLRLQPTASGHFTARARVPVNAEFKLVNITHGHRAEYERNHGPNRGFHGLQKHQHSRCSVRFAFGTYQQEERWYCPILPPKPPLIALEAVPTPSRAGADTDPMDVDSSPPKSKAGAWESPRKGGDEALKVGEKMQRQVDTAGCEVCWQHQTPSEPWTNCPEDVSRQMESAFKRGLASITLRVGFKRYEVNLDTMEQRLSSDSSRVRRLRRMLIPPPALGNLWHPCLESLQLTDRQAHHQLTDLPGDLCERAEVLAQCYAYMLQSASSKPATLPLPPWRGLDVDAWAVLAALCVATCQVCPLGFQPDEVLLSHYGQDGASWKEAVAAARLAMSKVLLPSLQEVRGSFSWLRTANDGESRSKRRAAACQHLASCSVATAGCLTPRRLSEMLAGTRIVTQSQQVSLSCPRYETVLSTPVDTLLLDAALECRERFERIAVVNAASAFQPGGGFLTGGRHALEEAMCMQTTLYFSLAQASRTQRGQHEAYIPEDGCVLSPDVEILRRGTSHGYRPLMEAVPLAAVISLAMPNRNPSVRDSPVDRSQGLAYQALVRRKLLSALYAAIEVKAEAVLLPDCGCGVFQNDPEEVGECLGYVLEGLWGYFKEVVLVGSGAFVRSVRKVLARYQQCGQEVRFFHQLHESFFQESFFQSFPLETAKRWLCRVLQAKGDDLPLAVETLKRTCHSQEDTQAAWKDPAIPVVMRSLQSMLWRKKLVDFYGRPVWVLKMDQWQRELGESFVDAQLARGAHIALQSLCLLASKVLSSWDFSVTVLIQFPSETSDMEDLPWFRAGPPLRTLFSIFLTALQAACPELLHRLLLLNFPEEWDSCPALTEGLSARSRQRVEKVPRGLEQVRLSELMDASQLQLP